MQAAEEQLQTALTAHAQAPEDLATLRQICASLIALNRHDELAPWAVKGLALAPNDMDFAAVQAIALGLRGQHSAAIAVWRRYASLPWNPLFYHGSLGPEMAMAGDFAHAIPALRNAWRAALADGDPFAATAEWVLGESLLKTGRATGFSHWRARNAYDCGNYRPIGVPGWTKGQDLRGQRILVTGQLGFGDQFLLFSQVHRWMAAGAVVMITCDPHVHAVMQASLPTCVVVEAPRPTAVYAPLPEALAADVEAFAPSLHISLLDLPVLAAGRSPLPRPYFPAYLQAPAPQRKAAAAWARNLRQAHPGKALIGLFWDCLQRHDHRSTAIARCWAERRSLPLGLIERLTNDAGVRAKAHFVILHQSATEALAGTPVGNISRYAPGITDFADTAACIAQLDRVMAADSVAANLSAMLGQPTTVLANTSADWRWGAHGPNSPWMDRVKVLRQSTPGDWRPVIDQAIRRLSR